VATRDTIVVQTGEEIPFRSQKKDVENPRIEVTPDGAAILVHSGVENPKQIIRENLDWVTTQYQKQAQEIQEIESRYDSLSDGLVLWGKSFRIVEETGQFDVRTEEDEIHIITPQNRATLPYLHNQVKTALRVAVQTIADHMADQLDVGYDQLSIRKQRTKWASCSGGTNLNFNIRAAFLPIKHLEYLVAHEVSHLKHPSHNDQFWATVTSLSEDYESLREELQGFWYLVHRNEMWAKLIEH
jgi:predicted metal-dependent hydrolase